MSCACASVRVRVGAAVQCRTTSSTCAEIRSHTHITRRAPARDTAPAVCTPGAIDVPWPASSPGPGAIWGVPPGAITLVAPSINNNIYGVIIIMLCGHSRVHFLLFLSFLRIYFSAGINLCFDTHNGGTSSVRTGLSQ